MTKKKDVPWRAHDALEWTYERKQGDIVVYARTAKEALETIRTHGFIVTDPDKLKQTGGRLTDVIKKEGIS